jgi:hypothetical protein
MVTMIACPHSLSADDQSGIDPRNTERDVRFPSLGRQVAYASSCRLNDSARFDPKPVIHSESQTLLTANVALRRLHGDMPQKKLDLLKLAARIMAESSTGASEIVWSKTWNVHTRSRLFDHVPDRLFRDAVPPEFTRPADTSEQRTAFDAGCRQPCIECIFYPIRYRNSSYMPSLAYKIHDGPALLATLQALQHQFRELAAAQPATKQDGQNRSIPLSGESLGVG